MCIWPQESSCATSQNAQDFPLRLVILKCIIPLIILILCHFTISFYHLFLKLLVQELFYSFNFCFLQLCLRSSPLPAVWVRSCPWTRPTSHIFILHGQQITEDDLRLNRPPYRREREKKNSPRQNITVNSLTLQGRPKKADKLCWCEVAVGCSWECSTRFCLHAHSYQHGLGPEGTSRRMNKRGREKCECQRQKQREDNRWWKCDKRGWMLTWRHGENKWRRVKNNRSEKEKVKERKALMPSLLPHLTSSDDSWSCLPFSGETSVTFPEYINSWGAAKGKQQCGFVYYSPTWATASINEEQSAKSRSDLSAWSDFHSANNRLSTYALFHQSAWFSHSYTHPLLLPETN